MTDWYIALSEGWANGKKRRSRHSNEVFATRKDRRIFDSQFLKPREKKRRYEGARRAKSHKIGAELFKD